MKKRKKARKARHKARAKTVMRRERVLERPEDRKKIVNRSTPSEQKESVTARGDKDFHRLDVESAIAAASRLHFMTLDGGVGPPTPLNRPTVDLLREFFQALEAIS